MEINQKCVIRSDHQFHPGRVGFFQFFGKGESQGCVVLSEKPTSKEDKSTTYFAVGRDDIVIR